MAAANETEIMTIAEAAELAQVSHQWARAICARIGASKHGRDWKVPLVPFLREVEASAEKGRGRPADAQKTTA